MSTSINLATEPELRIAQRDFAALEKAVLGTLQLIQRGQREGAIRSILVGLALHRVKGSLKHGQWEPWLKRNTIPFLGKSYARTASNYMRLAAVFVAKSKVGVAEIAAAPGSNTELVATDGPAKKFMSSLDKFVGEESYSDLLEKHVTSRKKPASIPEGSEDGAATKSAAPGEAIFSETGEMIRLLAVSLHDPNALIHLTRAQRAQRKEDLWGLYDGYRALHEEAFGKKK